MDSISFHDRLKAWSSAEDPDDLVRAVLGGPQKSIIDDGDVAREASSKIQNFLTENASLISKLDLPALNNLGELALRFTVWSKHNLKKGEKDYLTSLEDKVNDSIKKASNKINQFSFLTKHLPPELAAITTEYFSLGEIINLALLEENDGNLDANLLRKELSSHLFPEEIHEFIKNAIDKIESGNSIEKGLLLFFRNASLDLQNAVFKELKSFPFDQIEKFLTAIPTDVTYLDLSSLTYFADSSYTSNVLTGSEDANTLKLALEIFFKPKYLTYGNLKYLKVPFNENIPKLFSTLFYCLETNNFTKINFKLDAGSKHFVWDNQGKCFWNSGNQEKLVPANEF